MKKIFVSALLAITLQAPGQDATKKFNLFTSENFKIDLKFIDPAKGSFGVDYELDMSRKLTSLNEKFKNLNFGLTSKGFVTVVGDKNNNNSIISQLKFEAFPLFKVNRSTPATSISREELMDTTTNVITSEDPLINLSRQLAEQVSSPLWVFFNVNGKNETTQDFKNYDFTIGAQLSFTSSYLNNILDFPFRLIRVGPYNNPRQLDLSIGYDYVTGVNRTALKSLMDASDFMNRLHFKGEWETGIFTPRDRLLFYYEHYKALNPTQKLKDANKADSRFFMIKIEHLLSADVKTKTLAKIALKYTHGELPPNFVTGYVLGGGFSLEF